MFDIFVSSGVSAQKGGVLPATNKNFVCLRRGHPRRYRRRGREGRGGKYGGGVSTISRQTTKDGSSRGRIRGRGPRRGRWYLVCTRGLKSNTREPRTVSTPPGRTEHLLVRPSDCYTRLRWGDVAPPGVLSGSPYSKGPGSEPSNGEGKHRLLFCQEGSVRTGRAVRGAGSK